MSDARKSRIISKCTGINSFQSGYSQNFLESVDSHMLISTCKVLAGEYFPHRLGPNVHLHVEFQGGQIEDKIIGFRPTLHPYVT